MLKSASKKLMTHGKNNQDSFWQLILHAHLLISYA